MSKNQYIKAIFRMMRQAGLSEVRLVYSFMLGMSKNVEAI